jgi:SAM-dependent methyltransferase
LNLRNAWYFTAGIGFLVLAKAKHVVRGYSTPKPFDISETERCIAYDRHVVEDWLRELARYTGSASIIGKNILELGPGSDLGVGILLLARGALKYNACDVHDLIRATPERFYEALFAQLAGSADIAVLRDELEKLRAGMPSALNYRVQGDFDLTAAIEGKTIDVVFSQAAFEHFDDVDAVIGQLSMVCRSGAVLVAEIDLKTHSRWIRDKDPNNIYRYPPLIYDALRFRGTPNRVRPYQYRQILERHGWTDVQITPRTRLPDSAPTSGMYRRFATEINDMQYLTILLSARMR